MNDDFSNPFDSVDITKFNAIIDFFHVLKKQKYLTTQLRYNVKMLVFSLALAFRLKNIYIYYYYFLKSLEDSDTTRSV